MNCPHCKKEIHCFVTDKGLDVAVDHTPMRIMNDGHLIYGYQLHSDTCPVGHFLSEEHDIDEIFDKKVQTKWTANFLGNPKL